MSRTLLRHEAILAVLLVIAVLVLVAVSVAIAVRAPAGVPAVPAGRVPWRRSIRTSRRISRAPVR